MKKYCIGIDPDIEESGFAVWDKESNEFVSIKCKPFSRIVELLLKQKDIIHIVVVEAGWLIPKSNWHGAKTKEIAGKIGRDVGRNHQVGILLVEWCKHNGIPVREVKPMGKVTHAYFKRITRWPYSTNQDKRDAAMLVFGM